jgi:hypothetical protein
MPKSKDIGTQAHGKFVPTCHNCGKIGHIRPNCYLLRSHRPSVIVFFFGHILLCFPGPSETVKGSNFYYSDLSLLCLTLCPFVTKRGSNFYLWTGNVFPNRSSVFVPKWPNGEFVNFIGLILCLDKNTYM